MTSGVHIKKFKEILSSNDQKLIQDKFTYDINRSPRDAKALLLEMTMQAMSREYSQDKFFYVIDWLYMEHQTFLNSCLIEVLWLCGFNERKPESDETQSYSLIVNGLINRKIVSPGDLLEKLEESSLKDCGLISDIKTFRTKITRLNTKITYEQQKYNLLREESEGFAKLIFLLFEVEINNNNLAHCIDKILSLIGFFDLDPVRVLDLILSSFAKDPFNLNYLQIIKILNLKALPHVLGYKFTSSKEEDSGLYIVAGQLIKYNFIQLVDLLSHISPNVKTMELNFNATLANTNTINSTLQIRVAKELSYVPSSSTTSSFDQPTQSANYFCNFREILKEVYPTKRETHQILKLFEGLVRVRSSIHCEMLYSLIENGYDPIESKSLLKALCDEIGWMIKPLVKPDNIIIDDTLEVLLGEFRQVRSSEEFIREVPKLLKYVTLGLGFQQILFQKILRVIKNHPKLILTHENIIIDLVIKVFLPSLSLCDPTPALVNELWSVVSLFEYNKRYKIYNYWVNNIYNTHPALFLRHGVIQKETSKWQKTLTKENQRQHGRTLGILTNSNPVIVLDNVIKFLTCYDNQINIFIQTLIYASPLALDVVTFIICKTLADPTKDKLNTNTCEVASWFKFFCYFVGNFYKKFHTAEFGGLITFLCGKLKNSQSYTDLYVLKEMIEKMSGVSVLEEMNESQVHSYSGGLYLFLESQELSKEHKYLKKPIQGLMKFFLSNAESSGNEISFTSTLIILLAIKRQSIIYNQGQTQPKLISSLYDQMQNIFIQFVTFVYMYNDAYTYSKFLPAWPYERLVLNFNMQPETVFYLIRFGLKPIYDLTEEEYTSQVTNFTKVFDSYLTMNKNHFNSEFDSIYLDKNNFVDELYRPIWKFITPELYFLFSSLQLKDIFVPIIRYEAEIEKNNFEKERILDESKSSSDNKYKKEIEKINNNIDNLNKEMKNLKSHVDKVIRFLETRKNLMDNIPVENRREVSRYMIQYLLYPRLTFSKVEAVYSAKMLVTLINLRIQNLNVFDIMQKLIKYFLPCILSVTEFEAQNIGFFLNEFLKAIKGWQDEKIWQEECLTNPCFSRMIDAASSVELADFKKAIIYLLIKMNSTFLSVFNSEDYTSCRNALIVLNIINSVYPPTKEIATDLIKNIGQTVEKFERYDDLTMMMKRYKDILSGKLNNLPSEGDFTGEKSIDNKLPERDRSSSFKRNGDKKKKKETKERSREREKRKDDSSSAKLSDGRRKSPDDYKSNRSRNESKLK